MADQNYANHRHQPVLTLAATACWLIAVVAAAGQAWWGWSSQGLATAALLAAVFAVIWIGRTYTTRLQDRVILLEMKVRCAEVLPAGEDAKLAALTKDQIVSLRFASDAELGALVDRAVRDHLSGDDIKKAITQWKADLLRT